MAEKVKPETDQRIIEHLQAIDALRAEAAARPEYPKWIADPTDETGQRGTVAEHPDHEKKIVASAKSGAPVGFSSADQKAKAQEIRDAENPSLGEDVVKVQIVDPKKEAKKRQPQAPKRSIVDKLRKK